MAVHVDLECYEGEDFAVDVTVEGSGSIAGQGWAFVLSDIDGVVVLRETTVGGGLVITEATARTMTLTLSSGDTNRTPGEYRYEVNRTDAGYKTVGAKGKFDILDSLDDVAV